MPSSFFSPSADASSRPTPSLRPLQLGASHFAFMRALVQGVPLRESWLRYLHPQEAGGALADQAGMRATVQWIRDAFAAAARRERRHGIARLVLVDLSRVPDDDASLPSLEAFAAERGLEDFSEAEQVEAYEAAHGRAAARQGRRARLVERQLEALRWLETLAAQPPRPADAVEAWLPPQIAARLASAGLTTLLRLVDRINGAPGRWWSSVRGVGRVKARRVEAWLREHEAVLGLALLRPALQEAAFLSPADDAPHAQAPAGPGRRAAQAALVVPATAVRPLEKFVVPAALDGRQGRFRRPAGESRLGALADREALQAWLAAKSQASPHTRRAYRREAERFLLWAVLERGVALSSVAQADAAAYLAFVANPQPRDTWCGPRHHPRWSPLWRPFEGPLSPAARRQTVTILRNLYGFLEEQGHLAGNPWHGAAAGCVRRPALDAARSLSPSQRLAIEHRLHLLPDSAAALRLRLAWLLLQSTGLRLAEAVAVRLRDLRAAQAPDTLWLHVAGPGHRGRDLLLPPALGEVLRRSLVLRGLPADPLHPGSADAYLLGHATDMEVRAPGLAAGRNIDPRQGIAPQTLYDQFKTLFRRCAQACRARGDTADADRLRRASTHWLRHTHALQALARGVPLGTTQHRLGHAAPSTTALYAAALRP
ncbi:phage integrase family protein [Aquincola sp. MAHUQ-54]|uniref:Phage integrase family protein n=1 Tax=Aquincola agrisoli TaxID=3119538 RepID=A0AAW9PYR4_9BURK